MSDQENKVIIGSCIPKNVERISAALKNDLDCKVVESWDRFEGERLASSRLTFLTDLNLSDYFPSIVFESMLEIGDSMAIVILLEDMNTHTLYRKRAHDLWEILPFDSVDDGRFCSIVKTSQFRFEMWSPYS